MFNRANIFLLYFILISFSSLALANRRNNRDDADINFNVNSYDFGTVVTGNSKTHSFTIKNDGDRTAKFLSFTGFNYPFSFYGGSYPGIGGSCKSNMKLMKDEDCKLVFIFNPTQSANFSGSITILYEDGNGTSVASLPITGKGQSPANLVFLEGPSYSYISQTIGAPTTHQFTLTNTGEFTAKNISYSILTNPFSIIGGNCTSTLASNASCFLTIQFLPTSPNSFSQNFNLSYFNGNQCSASTSINLKGQGLEGNSIANLTATNADFGTLFLNQSRTLLIAVNNTGNGSALNLIYSSLNSPFSFTGGIAPGTNGSCTSTILAETSCTIELLYSPTSVGASISSLTIQYNNGQNTTSIVLSLSGQVISPAILISSTNSINFGNTSVNFEKESTITFINYTATAATQLQASSLSGDFKFKGGSYPGTLGTCSNVLAGGFPGCTIVITYQPTATGVQNTSLNLSYFNGIQTKTLSINLSGTGFSSGALDPEFNITGMLNTNFGTLSSIGDAVAMQGQRIIVAGTTHNGSSSQLSLARFNPNGTLDIAFGNGGYINTYFDGIYSEAFAIAIDSSNNIIATGYNTVTTSNRNIVIVKFTSEGYLDSSFNNGYGYVQTDTAAKEDAGYSIALQNDGKILIAGVSTLSTNNKNFIVQRYLSTGEFDLTFNLTGTVMTDFAIGIDKAFSLKVNSQGLITVAGFATVSGIAKLAIIQLLEDGNLNTEFGSLGKVIQTIGAGNTFATSLEVDTNGSFYVGAYTLNGSYNSFVVAKFSSLGLLDSTFGQNGITVVSPGTANNYLYSLNILPDGKLLLGGEAVFTDGEKKFATVKLNADGTVDSTFGNAGYNLTQFTDSLSSSGYAMTLNLSEGKYIQVGRTIVNGASQTAIAQYFQ